MENEYIIQEGDKIKHKGSFTEEEQQKQQMKEPFDDEKYKSNEETTTAATTTRTKFDADTNWLCLETDKQDGSFEWFGPAESLETKSGQKEETMSPNRSEAKIKECASVEVSSSPKKTDEETSSNFEWFENYQKQSSSSVTEETSIIVESKGKEEKETTEHKSSAALKKGLLFFRNMKDRKIKDSDASYINNNNKDADREQLKEISEHQESSSKSPAGKSRRVKNKSSPPWKFRRKVDTYFDKLSLSTNYQKQHSLPVGKGPSTTSIETENSETTIDDLYEKVFLVKPQYCFPEENAYMTKEEIHDEMMKPSKHFEFLESFSQYSNSTGKYINIPKTIEEQYGSPNDGRIGSLKVEVLSCKGIRREKNSEPDVAVYMVCGDAAFCTDVINDCSSPVWPCQSKRAAVFPLHHAYARIYVGVFDLWTKKNKDNDDFCGRITVDIASLRSDYEYDVTMPLRASTFVYDRRPRGTVRLRFSFHWFSERSAVLSYLRGPAVATRGHPLLIPCEDSKTFKNLATTLYGDHLPGKYSLTGFRATMREFNLYRMNLELMLKSMLLETMTYERPLLSLYLLFAWMHCVWLSSTKLVLPYVLGYVILLLAKNYFCFALQPSRNHGCKTLTIEEIAMSLFTNEGAYTNTMVDGQVSKKQQIALGPALNHLEFPFSEGETYPKFTCEEAIATKTKVISVEVETNNEESTLKMVYDSSGQGAKEEDAEGINFVREERAIEDNEAEEEQIKRNSDIQIDFTKNILSGPPQNQDITEKKVIDVPAQLAKVENRLHAITCRISQEQLYIPQTMSVDENGRLYCANINESLQQSNTSPSFGSAASCNEEFERILGLRQQWGLDPVQNIWGQFLLPVMNIFKILTVATRCLFNIFTWRDPYLTFWVICCLVVSMIILLFFPWRLFFFVVGFLCLGPQNILFRCWLQRKIMACGIHGKEESRESHTSTEIKMASVEGASSKVVTEEEEEEEGNHHKGLLKGIRRIRPKVKQASGPPKNGPKQTSHVAGSAIDFSGFATRRCEDSSQRSAKKNSIQPRAVIVPYSRLRKERFFDWPPPDPLSTSVTPISFTNNSSPRLKSYAKEMQMKTTGSEKVNQTVRRRHTASEIE